MRSPRLLLDSQGCQTEQVTRTYRYLSCIRGKEEALISEIRLELRSRFSNER